MQSGLPLVVVNHITFHVPTQPLPNPFVLSLMAIAAVAPIAPLSAQWRERLHCDSLLRLYGCAVACSCNVQSCGTHCGIYHSALWPTLRCHCRPLQQGFGDVWCGRD